MIPTRIPDFDKEQTRQLERDLNRKSTNKEISLWERAIEEAKKIKVK